MTVTRQSPTTINSNPSANNPVVGQNTNPNANDPGAINSNPTINDPPLYSPPSNPHPKYIQEHNFVKDHSATISFYHPSIGYLDSDYGINHVSWNYNLNVQRYPTYAGEVIQILSILVDDVTIIGQIGTYEQMELFFAYFASYMETATQGPGRNSSLQQMNDNKPIINASSGQGSATSGIYNEFPIRLTYPERGWNFYIQPTDMVGFRYARELAAPEWQITAAVYDTDPNLEGDLRRAITTSMGVMVTYENPQASKHDDTFDLRGHIGFNPNSPFLNPFPGEGITGGFNAQDAQGPFSSLSGYYNQLVHAYANNDYSDLMNQFGSGPLGLQDGSGSTSGSNTNPAANNPAAGSVTATQSPFPTGG